MVAAAAGTTMLLYKASSGGIQSDAQNTSKRPTRLLYEASPLEDLWMSKSGDKEWIDHPCDHLQDEARKWMDVLGSSNRLDAEHADWTSIFSVFKNDALDGSGPVISQPIEPLAYNLRAPTFQCSSDMMDFKGLYNVDWLVLATAEMYPNRDKSYFFDVGCTLYGNVPGTKFFVDAYNQNGIEFDHIYGREARTIEPKKYWDHVPDEMVHKMTFYNVPASKEVDEPLNPITLLKITCKMEDFCVLKIDVDTPVVEEAWIQQILDDPIAQSLIDELFFEHHVHGIIQGDKGQWWGTNVKGTFEDSYKLFTALRKVGIRAHSWV